jgi:hypothetical protein
VSDSFTLHIRGQCKKIRHAFAARKGYLREWASECPLLSLHTCRTRPLTSTGRTGGQTDTYLCQYPSSQLSVFCVVCEGRWQLCSTFLFVLSKRSWWTWNHISQF